MTKKEKSSIIFQMFEKENPNPQTELNYRNAYELTVSVALSAQCTDKRVNMVTPKLFKKYPNFDELSLATQDEIFEFIRSISYPRNKSKHLKEMAVMVRKRYKSELPKERDEMMKLPGVGQKTANVLASVLYNEPFMAVDTHVFRVSKRIGLVAQNCKTPKQVEEQLMKIIVREKVHKAHHWLILHGRYVCVAQNPKCNTCSITQWCFWYKKQRL